MKLWPARRRRAFSRGMLRVNGREVASFDYVIFDPAKKTVDIRTLPAPLPEPSAAPEPTPGVELPLKK